MNTDAAGALLGHPVARALGWSLVHFIWQGALVGIAAALALAAMRRASGQARYAVACAALAVMACAPIATTMAVMGSETGLSIGQVAGPSGPFARTAETTPGDGPAARVASNSGLPDASGALRATIDTWIPSLVAAWIVGVLLCSARLAAGWALLRRRLRSERRLAGDAWQDRLREISRRMGVTRAVRLIESSRLDVPCSVGWLRPVILVPASAFAGMAPSQLEAILAHELAHVRRHDYAVNLVQSVVETMLFYHPAVWWVSNRIRVEREYCCDDRVVALCGDTVGYARALADLESLRSPHVTLTVAASGQPLLSRVQRLLGGPGTESPRGPQWLGAALALVVVSVALGSGLLRADTPAAGNDGQPPRPVSVAPASAPTGPAAPTAAQSDAAGTADVPAPPDDLVDRNAWPTSGFSYWFGDAADPQAPPDVPPVPPVPPAPPTPPAPPAAGQAPPAPPTPPAPPESVGDWFQGLGDRHISQYHMSWSDNGRGMDVRARGTITFTDDDSDVKSVSAGGYVTITEKDAARHSYEIRSKSDGSLERLFDGKPAGADGRAFLARVLPDLIRQSGFGADARVRRILSQKGPGGVLDEITRIKSGYAKHLYYKHLLDQTRLDAPTMTRAIRQAGSEITSDYERASTLALLARAGLPDEPSRLAFAEAVRSMKSDYEKHRALKALMSSGSITAPVADAIVESARGMKSDYELAGLLTSLLRDQRLPPTSSAALFRAVDTIESDYERARVLSAACDAAITTPDMLAQVVRATLTMKSDYERANVLVAVAKRGPMDDALRKALVEAANLVKSNYEQNRVLAAVARAAGGA